MYLHTPSEILQRQRTTCVFQIRCGRRAIGFVSSFRREFVTTHRSRHSPPYTWSSTRRRRISNTEGRERRTTAIRIVSGREIDARTSHREQGGNRRVVSTFVRRKHVHLTDCGKHPRRATCRSGSSRTTIWNPVHRSIGATSVPSRSIQSTIASVPTPG